MNSHTRTSPPKQRLLLSLIWLFCAPGIICLLFAGVNLLSRFGLLPHSESSGWGVLGSALMLAPIFLLVAYGGVFIAVAIGLLGWRIISSEETSQGTKIEVVIAFAISVLSAIAVRFLR